LKRDTFGEVSDMKTIIVIGLFILGLLSPSYSQNDNILTVGLHSELPFSYSWISVDTLFQNSFLMHIFELPINSEKHIYSMAGDTAIVLNDTLIYTNWRIKLNLQNGYFDTSLILNKATPITNNYFDLGNCYKIFNPNWHIYNAFLYGHRSSNYIYLDGNFSTGYALYSYEIYPLRLTNSDAIDIYDTVSVGDTIKLIRSGITLIVLDYSMALGLQGNIQIKKERSSSANIISNLRSINSITVNKTYNLAGRLILTANKSPSGVYIKVIEDGINKPKYTRILKCNGGNN
jgi:hypothetical protein